MRILITKYQLSLARDDVVMRVHRGGYVTVLCEDGRAYPRATQATGGGVLPNR